MHLTSSDRAITVHQPWASLLATQVKRFETRSWPPPRGLIGNYLAIHAGRAALPRDLDAATVAAMERVLGLSARAWKSLPFGQIVCVGLLEGAYQVGAWSASTRRVSIAGVVPGSKKLKDIVLRPDESHFGDYERGRWLWKITAVRPLRPPAPAIGRQGIWRGRARPSEAPT